MNFKKEATCLAYLLVILLPIGESQAGITYYFSDQMNFQPNEARSHAHEITFTGNITIEIPTGFTLSNYTNGATLNGDNITWSSAASNTVNFTLISPSNCTEGDIFESKIYAEDMFYDEFTYVCIPDSKVVDFKVEYGHGNANYISNNELYISNESATLFNLIRVWNIGHYLNPNEPATEANIECAFEKNYTIRTYGRTNVTYSGENITANFYWDNIEGGYWFRIGVVSQDVKDKAVGNYYNVSCGDLTYKYEHQQVKAEFQNYGLEVRTTEPFNITVESASSTLKYTINNTEKYPVYSVYFDRLINGYTKTEYIPKLEPGRHIQYEADNTASYNLTIFFVSSWYRNSRNPQYYTQRYGLTTEEITPGETPVTGGGGTGGGGGEGGGGGKKLPKPPQPEGLEEKETGKTCAPWSNCSEYGLQTRSCEITKKIDGEIATDTIWEEQPCEYISYQIPYTREEILGPSELSVPLLKRLARYTSEMLASPFFIISGILLLLLLWLLHFLLIQEIVLDKSLLEYAIEQGVPIKRVLQYKFGMRISVRVPSDMLEDMLKEKREIIKKVKITRLITENNFKTLKTKNLIKWVKRHRAIIITANPEQYKREDIKVYQIKRFRLIEKKRIKEKKEKYLPKKEKQIKKAFIGSNATLLISTDATKYVYKILSIFGKLIRNKKIVYVSYNKLPKYTKRILQRHKINLDDASFINCVSERPVVKSEKEINVHLEDLTQLSIAITDSVKDPKTTVVIVDTISGFSAHHHTDVINQFVASMNDKARDKNYKILWISIDYPSEKELNTKISQLCDETIKI